MGYYVYIHTNRVNGKRYVGLTTQSPERRWSGGQGYESCPLFHRAVLKYGWEGFEHEIIECSSEEDMRTKESELIRLYDSTNPQKGYNLMTGGTHPIHSEESRKKISANRMGKGCGARNAMSKKEYREKVSASKLGTVLTQEQKQHLSDIHKGLWSGEKNPMYGTHRSGELNPFYGRVHSEETRRKISELNTGRGAKVILQYDKSGNLIAEWSSIAYASESLGIQVLI